MDRHYNSNRRSNSNQYNCNIPINTIYLSHIKIHTNQSGRCYMADEFGNRYQIDRSGAIFSEENNQRFNVGTIYNYTAENSDSIYYVDVYGKIYCICPADNQPKPAQDSQDSLKSTTSQTEVYSSVVQFAYQQSIVQYDMNNNIVENEQHRKRTTDQSEKLSNNYIAQESSGISQPKPWEIVYPLNVYPNYRCNGRNCSGGNGSSYAACIVNRPNVPVKIPCPAKKCKGELTKIAQSRWESSW